MLRTGGSGHVLSEKTERALLRGARGVDLIPAGVVAPEEALVVGLERLERSVGSVEGDVEEPGFAGLARLAEEAQRVIDVGHGVVEALRRDGPRGAVEAKCFVALVVVGRAGEVAEVALEAEIGRLLV